ncbi:hypothetical protein [Clostridium cylindrosporum]|uniref:Uncharacterized protein n=1 Tax=Clostridium cylindrosporum DSM 605 TaxID=1121307 RepID=A0A0J8DFK2_CLOCY|nr:hypothetical protein [Clostridium cylindrosporum]KMT22958.1 hypothetical protein CLCY_7c00050 [Clostridium cylindrosporum DSM 605]
MNVIKIVNITGLTLCVLGSIIVGLITTKGRPKPGQVVRFPNYKLDRIGWILIILGFSLSLIAAISA